MEISRPSMLHTQTFGQEKRGQVVLIHGLGEHSGRHHKMIQELTDAGYALSTFDWPGHGKSTGRRGHTTIEQAITIIDNLIEQQNTKPFLLGFSLGALTALRYAQRCPGNIRGVVASGPPLARRQGLSGFMVGLSKVVGMLLPSVTMNNTIKGSDISRNKEAVNRYCTDSLVHDRISAALARSLFRNMQQVHEDAACISAPVLILHGTADTLSPIEGTYRFMDELIVEDKELRTFQNSCHEIFEDPEWSDQFYHAVKDWLQRH